MDDPSPGLHVRVLAMTVPVLIAPKGTLRFKGEAVHALADGEARCIWIDAAASSKTRLEHLLVSVWQFWRFTVGQPATIAAEAELFSAAAEAVIEDLAAQGGVAALMALEPPAA